MPRPAIHRRSWRRRLNPAIPLLLVLCTLPPTLAAAQQLEDRILAIVDDDPILQSDVDRLLTLDPSLVGQAESQEARERRLVEVLIDQRLRSHEVERYGFGDVPNRLVDAQEATIEARYGSAEALDTELARVDWTRADLRVRIKRQLSVLTYVDELLGARVFVGLEEIQQHYDQELLPDLLARGADVPPLEEVREAIRELLRQQRLTEELARWTEELRAKADILNYFERPQRDLPPTVATRE